MISYVYQMFNLNYNTKQAPYCPNRCVFRPPSSHAPRFLGQTREYNCRTRAQTVRLFLSPCREGAVKAFESQKVWAVLQRIFAYWGIHSFETAQKAPASGAQETSKGSTRNFKSKQIKDDWTEIYSAWSTRSVLEKSQVCAGPGQPGQRCIRNMFHWTFQQSWKREIVRCFEASPFQLGQSFPIPTLEPAHSWNTCTPGSNNRGNKASRLKLPLSKFLAFWTLLEDRHNLCVVEMQILCERWADLPHCIPDGLRLGMPWGTVTLACWADKSGQQFRPRCSCLH